MAILNITYNGIAADYSFDVDETINDSDIRRMAVELIRSGEIDGLHIAHISPRAFEHYIVDRLRTAQGKQRIYLRPKVPFGASLGPVGG